MLASPVDWPWPWLAGKSHLLRGALLGNIINIHDGFSIAMFDYRRICIPEEDSTFNTELQ
jgi:hypothetical protein